ncbi:hypothetical protein KEM09_15150 [Carboxylicivirga mesophila]|uniref:Uncharacterized protein n=1 Tax=Carboxylicivirga mesophila TaxID=1166478 RepID=A0ABS5KCP2_9BACT|nr:hypothetical protein [Carboxylicivirga mesophila]MBS2212755.1 hypothetical protein [Carboxylicivirga mesophila]
MKNIRNIFWIVYLVVGTIIGIVYLKSDFDPINAEKEFDMFNALVVYPEVQDKQQIASRVQVVKVFKGYTLITDTKGNKFSVFSREFNPNPGYYHLTLFNFVEINDLIARAPYSDTLYLYKSNGEKLPFKIKFR